MIETYQAKLSPSEWRALQLIHASPGISRGELACQYCDGKRDASTCVGTLVNRLRRSLADLRAPFIIRSKQWRGYWIEHTKATAFTLRDIIAHGLRDHYHNGLFCERLADNVLASLAEAGISVEGLDGVRTGTHVIVPISQLRGD